ncbi:MAG: glycerate kinase, partial [Oscillospiraceae bacterium]
MKKCIIIPDSFKGTLSAMEYCEIASERVQARFPDCEIIAVPVADGGEGTVECFLSAMSGERVVCTVAGPLGDPVRASYARFGTTAVIEMAQAAGLPLIEDRRDPCRAGTYGVGELARHAAENGCTELVIGLGGSSTNDAACGMAAALGVRFFDAAGESFLPTGGTLERVASIDCAPARALLAGCTVTAMCDIDNPMFGPTGAAYVFGPEKGA